MSHLRSCLAMVAVALMLGACSGQPSPTPEQQKSRQKAANETAANEKLDMFHQMMDMKRPQLAVSIGDEILKRYPDTKAAVEIGRVLPKIKAKSEADTEASRLANLWLYQVSPMSGGTQSTATIDVSQPDESKVRLVLRRHSDWGTSAFLYDNGKNGFVCRKQCSLTMHFDGKRHAYKAYKPEGGEPALFIKDWKGFVKRMRKADKIDMDVIMQGQGKKTLVFEVGGFKADKWKALD